MRRAVTLASVGLALFAIASQAAACTLITAENPVDGWGAAHNVFSSASELILRADCALDSFTPQIGSSRTGSSNFAVYTTGYYFDGSSWQEMSYSPADGAQRYNAWIIGDAEASESIEYQTGNTFFAAFTCHWDGVAWNCGCQDEACGNPAWQLQAVAAPDLPSDTTTFSITQQPSRLAREGEYTFRSSGGADTEWTVDRATRDEDGGSWQVTTSVARSQGREASFELAYRDGFETVYTVTATDGGAEASTRVQVFPTNTRASFTHESAGNPDVRVYVVVPDGLNRDSELLMVHHGMSRNADDYILRFDEWASETDTLVLAPEFSEADWPRSHNYNLGNMFSGRYEGEGELNPRSQWSFTVASDIGTYALGGFELRDTSYLAWGHSAGGQFVHRMMLFLPEAPISLGMPANPGWWTEPSLEVSFPYGAAHPELDITEADLQRWAQHPTVIFRGTEDTVRSSSLRQNAAADAQGPHRYARAGYMYEQMLQVDPNTAWELVDVPNCGHSSRCMAEAAQVYLDAR